MADTVHPNLALVQRMYECFNKNDMETIRREIFAPDLVWNLPGRHPLAGTKHGADEVLAFFSQLVKGNIQVTLDPARGSEHRRGYLRGETRWWKSIAGMAPRRCGMLPATKLRSLLTPIIAPTITSRTARSPGCRFTSATNTRWTTFFAQFTAINRSQTAWRINKEDIWHR